MPSAEKYERFLHPLLYYLHRHELFGETDSSCNTLLFSPGSYLTTSEGPPLIKYFLDKNRNLK